MVDLTRLWPGAVVQIGSPAVFGPHVLEVGEYHTSERTGGLEIRLHFRAGGGKPLPMPGPWQPARTPAELARQDAALARLVDPGLGLVGVIAEDPSPSLADIDTAPPLETALLRPEPPEGI